MQKEKLILSLIVLTGLLGLILFGNGISGMVVSDSTVKELCSPKNEIQCSNPSEKCCLFYGEESGICNTENMCDQVTELTKNEKERNAPILMAVESQNNKLNLSYILQASFGALMVILLSLVAYYYITHHKVELRKRKVHSN